MKTKTVLFFFQLSFCISVQTVEFDSMCSIWLSDHNSSGCYNDNL